MTTSGTYVNCQATFIGADDIGQIRSLGSSFTSAHKTGNQYVSIIFIAEVELSNSVTVECNDLINTNNRQRTIELEGIE